MCLAPCSYAFEEAFPTNQIEQSKTNFNHFSLVNLMDNLLALDNKEKNSNVLNPVDKKTLIRREFISITSKFNQGNATVAYDEYEDLIDKIDDDVALIALSNIFYKIGFFSLANTAVDKVTYKNQYYDNLLDLERSYKIKANLTQEDEIYFAKLYSSIYFDNSAQEALNELLSKKDSYNKNDYYYFMLSRAYNETKKYQEALNSINKAISINNKNLQYEIFKVDILANSKKFSDALKIVEKLEKSKLPLNFEDSIKIKKELLFASSTKNDKEKKYHTVKKAYLEGHFEKAKKDCQNILNFDKDNSKVITIYAKSELAQGEIEKAKAHFNEAYKLDKHNIETLLGLADIKYIEGEYKNSTQIYKNVYNQEKNDPEILIKLVQSEKKYSKKPKELKKYQQKLDKTKNNYLEYYKAAMSFAQNNDILKEEYLKKSLLINPLYENAMGALVELYLKNKKYELAKGLIYNASFTLEKNYYYYYLCGLYNQALNNNKEAMQFYKTSLSLNNNFEVANIRILKLIPNVVNEEI